MKKTLLAGLLILLIVSCKAKPTAPVQPVLHVISYDSCERPQLIGTVKNMRYELNLKVDKETAMTVACPNPGLESQDIGKDFPAFANLDRGLMTVELPVFAAPTLEQLRTGQLRGVQTGTEKVEFEIAHMEELHKS